MWRLTGHNVRLGSTLASSCPTLLLVSPLEGSYTTHTSNCSVFSFCPARMSQSMTKPSCPARDTHNHTAFFPTETTTITQRTCAHQYPGISWMCLQHEHLTGMTLQCKPHTIAMLVYHSTPQYTFSITLHTTVYLQHNKYKTLYMYKYVCA